MPPRTKRSRAGEENFNKRTDQILLIRDPEDTGDQGQNVFNLDEVYSSLEESLIDNPNNQHKNTPLKKSVECQTESYQVSSKYL
jgi:hypothetical protein